MGTDLVSSQNKSVRRVSHSRQTVATVCLLVSRLGCSGARLVSFRRLWYNTLHIKEWGIYMMKKRHTLLVVFLLLLIGLLSACTQPQLVDRLPADFQEEDGAQDSAPSDGLETETPDTTTPTGYEVALITDGGDVESGGFNQSAWEGIVTYGDTFSVTYQWYQPVEASTAAFSESIAEAVRNGAKLVICSGSLFGAAVYEAQYTYPEISFICIDCDPTSATGDQKCEENVYSMYFSEEQLGFLAGYAAVVEGYTRLGFLGAMSIPTIVDYGAGFLQGVDQAAQERGITVEVTYGYTGSFQATQETQTLASTWYLNNTQCIFACGGEMATSVMIAAEAASTMVICADTDQYAASDSVLTSAVKNVKTSVFNGIDAYYGGNFPGGQILDLTAEQGGVMLAMDHARFTNFTKTQHNELLALLASGQIQVQSVDAATMNLHELVSDAVILNIEQ